MENIKKLSNVDLNLLTTFMALEETRSVTRGAKALGISQPAMSHALSRLRRTLNDPLFVRTPKAMVPTPKAQEFAPVIRELLLQVESRLLESREFNSSELDRVFNIKTTDFIEALILPRLMARLETDSPLVKVSVTSPEFRLPREKLEQGTCDLAIGGFFGSLPDGFYRQKLFADDFSCAAAKSHPHLAKKGHISIDDLCRERHTLIAPGGELSAKLDQILKNKSKSRVVVAGLSNFMVSGWIIEQTNTILIAPSRLIELLSQSFDLKSFTPPVKIPKITIVQVWHERNHHDPAHRWFRGLIQECL